MHRKHENHYIQHSQCMHPVQPTYIRRMIVAVCSSVDLPLAKVDMFLQRRDEVCLDSLLGWQDLPMAGTSCSAPHHLAAKNKRSFSWRLKTQEERNIYEDVLRSTQPSATSSFSPSTQPTSM